MSRTVRTWALVMTTVLVLVGGMGADTSRGQCCLPRLKVLVGDQILSAEVPMRAREVYRGLSGRTGLEPDAAMLFFWRQPFTPSMHMKNMLFSLDFLWVRSGKVIGITRQVPPAPLAPGSIMPPEPIDLALEVPAGWAAAHGVTPGTPVRLQRDPDTSRGDELTLILSRPDYQEDGVR